MECSLHVADGISVEQNMYIYIYIVDNLILVLDIGFGRLVPGLLIIPGHVKPWRAAHSSFCSRRVLSQ